MLAVAWEKEQKCICLYDIRLSLSETKLLVKLLDPFMQPIVYSHDVLSTGLCFHPSEPFICHGVVDRSSGKGLPSTGTSSKQTIRLHFMLMPSTPIIAEENVCALLPVSLQETNPIVLDLACSDIDGSLLISFGSPSSSYASKSIMIHAVFRLRSFFNLSINSPISSTLSVPPDTFLDGDGVMKINHISDANPSSASAVGTIKSLSSSWPMIVLAKKNVEISSRGMKLSYDFYRCGLGLGVTDTDTNTTGAASLSPPLSSKKESRYLGRVDAMINIGPSESAIANSSFPLLQPDDLFVLPGSILAHDIKFNEAMLNSSEGFVDNFDQSNGRQSFEFLVRSSVILLSYSASDSNSFIPMVSYMRYEKFADTLLSANDHSPDDIYKLRPIHSSFRDADFWTGPSPSVRSVSPDQPSGILGLSSDGLTLKWVLLGTTSASSGSSPSTGKLAGTWRFEREMRRFFVSPIGAPNVILYAASAQVGMPETLLLSSRGSPDLGASPYQFALKEGEVVQQVAWQSIPSAYSTKRTTADNTRKLQQRVWLTSSAGPLLGILTNQRVILMTSSLEIMNCSTVYDKTGIRSPAISLSWVGCALVYPTSDNQVSYLLPALRLRNLTRSLPNVQTQQRLAECGLNENDFGHGRLCSLADNLSNVHLVACLPDRLIFTCSERSDGYIDKFCLRTRPIFLVEPVMLGLLIRGLGTHARKLPSSSSSSTSTAMTSPLPPTVAAQLSSSSSSVDTYHQQRIETLIQLAISFFYSRKTDSNLLVPPSSHITVKLLLAMQACGPTFQQITSLIANIPNDEDAKAAGYPVTGNFPAHRWIPNALRFDIALQCDRGLSAALGLVYGYPKINLYDRVFDTSSLVGGLLPTHDSTVMRQLEAAVKELSSHGHLAAAERLAAICNASAPILTERNPSDGIAAEQLFARCKVELPSTTTSSMKEASKEARDVAALIKKRVSDAGNNLKSSIGPQTQLTALAMSSIDDIIGLRSKPEAMSSTATLNRFLGPSITASHGNETTAASSILPSSLMTKPSSWVDELPIDKLVGYWRFSDAIFPDETGFSNTSLLTRIVFVDLGRYAAINALELVIADQATSTMTIETSSSNVDPGEDHERVKALYDLVYPAASSASLGKDEQPEPSMAELRILVGRGGPFDLGIYHHDPNRLSMTTEMMLYCGSLSSSAQRQSIILWQRRCFAHHQHGKVMYQLAAFTDGSLRWKMNDIEKKSEVGALFDPSFTEFMEWKHLAIIFSSSAGSSTIKVLVDNKTVIEETIAITLSYAESDLASTMMIIGRDCPAAWRLTELRIWSCSRTSGELDENKETYLNAASKKKRQQLRMKRTKELFKPLRDGYGGPVSSAKPTAIALPNLHASQLLVEASTTTIEAGVASTTSAVGGGEQVTATKLGDSSTGKRLSTFSPPPTSGGRPSIAGIQAPPVGKRGSQAILQPPKPITTVSADAFDASFASFPEKAPGEVTATANSTSNHGFGDSSTASDNKESTNQGFQDEKW
jgi:hypothetical protein